MQNTAKPSREVAAPAVTRRWFLARAGRAQRRSPDLPETADRRSPTIILQEPLRPRRRFARHLIASLTWFALVGVCLQAFAARAGPVDRPNFVFILSDDQDWTGLSVQMHDAVPNSKSDFYRTPNLKKLAEQGMRFTDGYAPAPVCSPTRYSLQTGKSPAQLHWTKASPVMTAADESRLRPEPASGGQA